MTRVDMSPKAISTSLKRVEQLRHFGLSLQKTKPKGMQSTNVRRDQSSTNPRKKSK